jgi:glucose/arabinose dehydrogenase
VLLAGCSGRSDDGGGDVSNSNPTVTSGSSTGAPATGTPFTGALPAPGTVATDLDVPWGVGFLPDGQALVAERDTGRILQVGASATPREVMRLRNASATGEAGLLGIAVSPTYASDGLVYAFYTSRADNRIVRFRLGGQEEVIVFGIAEASIHDGGRLAFGPDGMLYATTGDAGQSSRAQDTASLNGKILRMRPDGSAPPDNPFPGSLVYSYGHRNPQGITWDSAGRLWSAEFGANSFDELNLIRPGGNYGWPQVEGRGDTRGGRFINPVVTWSTSEASPSGVAFWRGALYLAALQGQRIWRVPVDAQGNAGEPESLLRGSHGRLRTVAAAPDGSLWVTTSNRDGRGNVRTGDDRILRFAVR